MGLIIRKPQRPEAREMWDRLERERKTRIKEPRPKVQIEKREGLFGQAMIERIAQIWGFKLEEIYPEFRGTAFGNGYYDPNTHEVFESVLIPSQLAFNHNQHELVHASERLISPNNFKSRFNTNSDLYLNTYSKELQVYLKGEHIAQLSFEGKNKLNKTRLQKIISFITFPKLFGRFVEFLLTKKSLRNIYNIHGIDGLILYMIFPPRVYGTIENYVWRKRMEDLEILNPNGGLTQKGLEFIKKVLPREEILSILEKMKTNRKKGKK